MGLFKSLKRFLVGKSAKQKQIDRYSDEQRGDLDLLRQQGMEETNTGALEDRYRKMFEEQMIPGIAQQFTNMGAQRSGGFRSALGRAGGDLASQLAAMRSQRGMQKLGFGMQQQFDTAMMPGSPGLLQQAGGPLAQLLGGAFMGGGGGFGQQQQQQQDSYMPGQPQGFSSGNINPAMLKMLMGMLL